MASHAGPGACLSSKALLQASEGGALGPVWALLSTGARCTALSGDPGRSTGSFWEEPCSDVPYVPPQTNEADISVLMVSTWMTSQRWTPRWLPCISPKSKVSFYSSRPFLYS